MTPQRFDHKWLRHIAAQVLAFHNIGRREAELVADSLVTADLWGHGSHGILRLAWYVDRLRSGAMSAKAEPEIVQDDGAVAVMDGHNGVGQVIAARAATEALTRARRDGAGVIGVRSSNHFGTAAYFTRMAAHAGCVGLLWTNSSPAMPPWGGRDKLVGSNPWSIAVPLGSERVAVLDVSNTTVARGKLYRAQASGESIPEGWAVTKHGDNTTDPTQALEGMLLPMGGHKGYGMSFMVDMLAGVLTGSGFGTAVNGPYQAKLAGHSGHLYIAIDITRFMPLHEFNHRASKLINEVRSSGLRSPEEPIRYPGELEDERAAEYCRFGVPLPDETACSLKAEVRAAGLDWAPSLL